MAHGASPTQRQPLMACRAGVSGSLASAFFVLLAVFGMSAAAQLRVVLPFTEVPMTLQSLAFVLIGLTLPAHLAGGAMFAYLAVGAAGVPVFASGSLGLLGPTGGYLVGFAVGAPLIAYLRGSSANSWRLMAAAFAGTLVLFACGVIWLAVLAPGGFATAVVAGFLPFVTKALVQIVLAVVVVQKWRRFANTVDRRIRG